MPRLSLPTLTEVGVEQCMDPPAEIVSDLWMSRILVTALPSDISDATVKIGAYFVSRRFTNQAPIKEESAYLKIEIWSYEVQA